MIEEGLSPYFTKYGFADFEERHALYLEAERRAQSFNLGVWDQLSHDGAERRNYAALGSWWTMRAELVQAYRRLKQANVTVYDTRFDYELLREKASRNKTATIFTELRNLSTIHNDSFGFIDIGSTVQRFTLFLPELDSEEGRRVLALLRNRYVSSGSDDDHPRRSYA